MALRSLSRAGVELSGRVGEKGTRGVAGLGVTHATRQRQIVGGAGRKLSSFVGEGQENFGGYLVPSYRQGSLAAGRQLFKLVETDLMSKELTRYGPSDAEHFGLYSIQDVLSDIAAATIPPQKPAAPTATAASSVHEEPAAPPAARARLAVRGEEVLAAWGLGPFVADPSEAQGVEAPGAGEAVKFQEEEADAGVVGEKLAIKRTYQPSTLKRKRKHGFLYRAKSRLGKKILRRRQDKGRWRLGI